MSCGCQTTSSNCVREPFNANFVRPLAYIRGVDANGCVSYAPASSYALTVQDTNTLDLTLSANTLSGAVRISSNAGNSLQALANGLYVPSSLINAIQDTTTVDLSVVAGVLSANVVVSPNAGNALQVLGNGLYVAPASFTLNALDTNTVDLTLAGNNLSAQVVISPNAGNALQALPNGLFVPPSTSITVQDTSSVDLTLTGGVLSADVIVSPNAGNQLQLLPNGLYVPPSSVNLTATDTNTVDLTLAGNNLSAQVIVSPNAGNALQALPNGLFVPASSSLSVQNTNTINLTLAGGVLSANVVVSPNAGNALQALSNGLFVPQYSLSNCAGSALASGTRVVTCPSANAQLNINSTVLSVSGGNTLALGITAKNCPEPENNDYIIAADNTGNVRYIQMREAIFHRVTPNTIVFPNLPLVTLQSPQTTTGTIDSASFTNPLNCSVVYPKGFANGVLQHSFNYNNSTSVVSASVSSFRDLISRIDNYNTPGITNTTLTGHGWRNQTVVAGGSNSHAIVDLGAGIVPAATVNFARSMFVVGNNAQYSTTEDWSAGINIFKL